MCQKQKAAFFFTNKKDLIQSCCKKVLKRGTAVADTAASDTGEKNYLLVTKSILLCFSVLSVAAVAADAVAALRL